MPTTSRTCSACLPCSSGVEQIDPEYLARASTERPRYYNRVLVSQLAELQDEIELQITTCGMDFGIEPWRRLNPHKLGPVLDDDVRQIRAVRAEVARELQQLGQPPSVKRWLQQERQRQRLDDETPFDPLF
jgi:hypothetical protein